MMRREALLRFKYFAGSGGQLESAVNQWLETYEPEVTHMTTSVMGDRLVVSFLFDESFRGQERRLAERRGMSMDRESKAPGASMPDDPVPVAIDSMG